MTGDKTKTKQAKAHKIQKVKPARVPKAKAVKAAKAPKAKKDARDAQKDFSWVAAKINSNDQWFAIEHSVLFLTDLFNHLIADKKVSQQAVEKLIQKTNEPISLQEILRELLATK